MSAFFVAVFFWPPPLIAISNGYLWRESARCSLSKRVSSCLFFVPFLQFFFGPPHLYPFSMNTSGESRLGAPFVRERPTFFALFWRQILLSLCETELSNGSKNLERAPLFADRGCPGRKFCFTGGRQCQTDHFRVWCFQPLAPRALALVDTNLFLLDSQSEPPRQG